MKTILQSLRLTLVLLVLLSVIYPLTIAFVARWTRGNGSGERLTKNGKVVGYALLGQSFTKPEYFWGRPSAVNYNAAGSGGSNKGPSNPDYLQEVSKRIDTLLKYNPAIKRSAIPSDLVTASGSGLDPAISVQGAIIQIGRIAAYRNMDASRIEQLVLEHIHHPFLGPRSVNVLQLNLALDELR